MANEKTKRRTEVDYAETFGASTPMELAERYAKMDGLADRSRYHERIASSGPIIDMSLQMPSGHWWLVIGSKPSTSLSSGLRVLKSLGNRNWDDFDVDWDPMNHELTLKPAV